MDRVADGALRDWVEEIAILLEQDGLPRMAGRIFGWLLVCEPPEQSMEDLAAAVQGSKASMSTMTRLLLRSGLAEKVRRPGSRRDGYRVDPDQWQQLWRSRMEMLREAADLTGRGLGLLASRPPAVRARIEMLHEQYRFFEKELPRLLDRWERERAPVARPGWRGRAGGRR